MKKKLLLIMLILVNMVTYAQEISLGTGTTTGGAPVNPYFRNSFCQQIFTQQEINAAGPGVITALKFYGSDLSTFSNTPNIKFWIGHTNKSSYSSTTDWISVDDLTLIHDGTIDRNDGVTTITIPSGFNYNNIDNIVIVGFKEATSGDAGINSRFYTYTGGASTVLSKNIDSPSATNPHSTLDNYQSIVGTVSATKSRITFVGLVPSSAPLCPTVNTPVANATNIAILPTITWAASNNATSYNIKIGTTTGGSDILDESNITNTSFTLTTPLSYSTIYYLTIEAVGFVGTSQDCTIRQFTTATPPPSNDECVNAIPLTVNSDLLYNIVTPATTLNATMSMSATPCGGTPSDDVWFSFVATATTHQIRISDKVSVGTNSTTDMYFQVLSGSCGDFTSLLCSDPDVNVISNLTVGQTYYIRAYTYTSNVNGANSFNIGIGTAVETPIPNNDECDQAVSLTVNPDYNYDITTQGTTASATQSMAATPCGGNPDDDVWYSFVATNTTHQIKISNIISVGLTSSTDMYFQVLDGICGQSTSLLCSDPETNLINNLTIGNTYFVRVYTFFNGSQYACNFNIGVGTPPPPPVNDECENAIVLTPGTTFAQNAVVGTNSGATNNTNIPAPTCDNYNFATSGKDVWYKVTIPTNGTLTLETNNNGDSEMRDTGMSAYTGTCANLTLIDCDADDSSDGSFSLINLVSRTPGEEILVRVWGYNTNEGSFRISAYDASLSSEDFTKSTIKLYPNPFTTDLQISTTENIVKATVIDVTGKIVKTFKNPTTTLPLSELSSGIYMVTLENANGVTKTIKAIKK